MSSVPNMGRVSPELPQRHSLVLSRRRGPGTSVSCGAPFKRLSHSQQLTDLNLRISRISIQNLPRHSSLYGKHSRWKTRQAIWETLTLENTNIQLYMNSQSRRQNLGVTCIFQKWLKKGNLLNIRDMNQNQILRAVAQRRIKEYSSVREAAKSLDIDIRTLQRYAQWKESDD